MTVTTDQKTYTTTELPTFTLSVTNTSDATCRRDVGQSALELRVSTGGTRVWSSDDCNSGGEPREKTLDPGDSFAQSVQWSRTHSEPGCPTPQEAAAAGTYQVVARDLEIISEPAVFKLQ
ncbi:MAG TPA: hypothetical protein VMT88_08145 [Actinomycetes bacterium]|nr:hypothetical protein [Actinomycetes bacterium]